MIINDIPLTAREIGVIVAAILALASFPLIESAITAWHQRHDRRYTLD